jgi:predicted AlkP superfamily pyrophosphatase or phosphodiesterase
MFDTRTTLVCGLAASLWLLASPLAADDDGRRQSDNHQRQVVVISLDGAKPDLIERYLRTGVLDRTRGLGALARHGVVADQNITATPSVTAVSHIAIATGSTAAHNDIPANSFHPVGATIGTSISGFAAPIGGYRISPLAPAPTPTAEPLWVRLREAGRKVVAATWPGAEGSDIRIAGQLVQSSANRSTDYSVPFGAFGGLGAQGFERTLTDFSPAPAELVGDLMAAGRTSFSPVLTTAVETVFCSPTGSCGTAPNTLQYAIRAAALDTSNDGVANYDMLVFYDAAVGVPPGPFALPSTGPAYVRAGGPSGKFFFEGSGNVVGTAYFVTRLAPDLSTVRFMRYAANFIPRNPAAIAAVDDINTHVGFWAPQPDFRIPERISPGFANFPDLELEAAYQDQVKTFVDYQTEVALRGIARVPDADLVMIYIEQPDGSGHQFTLTDPRQPTDFSDPRTIGRPGNPTGAIGQDMAKVQRYRKYLEFAYQQADNAVQRILEAVGIDRHGEPRRDVLVVSDHGMAPFHTAVSLTNLLRNAGVDMANSKVGIRTTGPAGNIYVNLQGREPPSGTQVAPGDYRALVDQIAAALRDAVDPNAYYNPRGAKLFSHVWTRPSGCGDPGFCTDENIGQDTGDVLALMVEGYNFDGIQGAGLPRLGDPAPGGTPIVYSVPNFYGAHGHDSTLPSMSAILYAAGPNIKKNKRLRTVRNIDIAPTIMELLGVVPAPSVDGEALTGILEGGGDD